MMQSDPTPSYSYLSHGGEERLQLRAGSLAELMRQAALALSQLMRPGPLPPGPDTSHGIVLAAPDPAALLIAWLNELLYLSERERWLPWRFEVHEATERHLRATVWGRLLEQAPSLIKAATWHGLRVDRSDDAYVAEVLFDV